MSHVSKLGLGTAQWGLDYGIANVTGRPSGATVAEMLDQAWSAGIRLVDTASAYGGAENMLGQIPVRDRMKLVTKTAVADSATLAESIRSGFERSLRRLGRRSIFGLLAHDAGQLLGSDAAAIWSFLVERKAAGVVAKIGVSVYTPDQLESVMQRFPIDLVQLPFNVYDQRFSAGGLLRRVHDAGVEIHLRSAFLQGALLLPSADLPAHFDSIRPHHERLHRTMRNAGWSPLEAALGFCLAQDFADQVIVGCETPRQLEEILDAGAKACDQMLDCLSAYSVADEAIILPTNWPQDRLRIPRSGSKEPHHVPN